MSGTIGSDGETHVGSGATTPPPIHEIVLYRSLPEAEAGWRAFERQALATPYQRFDFLEAWHRNIGRRLNVAPLIVHGRRADGTGAFLWPLAIHETGHLTIARWLGCKLVNYRFGLYHPGAGPMPDRHTIAQVLGAIRSDADVDAPMLTNQPETWQGRRNPLLRVRHQSSPSHAYSLRLQPDFQALLATLRSASTRKKLRRNERQIEKTYGSCALRRRGPRTRSIAFSTRTSSRSTNGCRISISTTSSPGPV